VLDAKLLAYHAITGMWPVSYLPPDEITTLKMILRAREGSKRAGLQADNRIGNIVTALGYPVGMLPHVRAPATRGIIEDLARSEPPFYSGWPEWAMHPLIGKIITRHYNTVDMEDYVEKGYLQHALELVRGSMLPCGTGQINGGELMKLLCTTPGIGEISALVWIGTVCDPRRFPNSKAVSAFAGCDPTLKVSAGKVTSYSRRGGNRQLHEVLLRAAMGC
jgi:hypothetical protein